MFIRTVAAEVRGHDAKYEANLRERERNNPKFGFLINKHVRTFVAVWLVYRMLIFGLWG
jgi:hypothetical protein